MKKITVTIERAPVIDRRKYRGLHVALVRGKVVASARTSVEAYHKAKKQYPKAASDTIELMSVPKEDLMVLIIV